MTVGTLGTLDPAPVGAPPGRRGMARIRRVARAGTLFWLIVAALLLVPIGAFLLLAVSPRLLGQGGSWLTTANLRAALSGPTLHAVADSLLVGVSTAVAASAIALALAWATQRTTLVGRRIWETLVWALLVAPTWMMAVGWERLLERGGVLAQFGIADTTVRHVFYGPVGVIVVLTANGVPFAYLALSAALRGLGSEFEEAARVHGGGALRTARVVLPILAPAIWSALAIVFAESVSDFGVAFTLAADAHFPVATYQLFAAVDNLPVQFGLASAIGWLLVAMAGFAVLAQSRALRGRSYRTLSARSRPTRRRRLSPAGQLAGVLAVSALFLAGLGVPVFAAVTASLITGFGSVLGPHGFTWANYVAVFGADGLGGPLALSLGLAALTATATTVLGVVVARVLTRGGAGMAARLLDLLLLGSVALPGIVLGAGYIFFYNLPVLAPLGLDLYGTTTLLAVGYVATALPTNSRVLVGTVAQLPDQLRDAARVHGGGPVGSWWRTVLPLLARPMVYAWLFSFTGLAFELPLSQLLYAPGAEPLSVAITKQLANYNFAGGMAMTVVSVGAVLLVVGLVLGALRLCTPAGWRRIGAT